MNLLPAWLNWCWCHWFCFSFPLVLFSTSTLLQCLSMCIIGNMQSKWVCLFPEVLSAWTTDHNPQFPLLFWCLKLPVSALPGLFFYKGREVHVVSQNKKPKSFVWRSNTMKIRFDFPCCILIWFPFFHSWHYLGKWTRGFFLGLEGLSCLVCICMQ